MPSIFGKKDPKNEIYSIVNSSLRKLSTSEVAARSNYSKPTVLKYLKKLNRQGEIRREKRSNTYYWYTGEISFF
ncbi:hypothetical protein AKJ50_00580 [candidate division MSBL1 archaeon SCGC-AAA382A13]|uniref:HTH arsR-type domain-containing protein n=1 Tax=candidate division MSBL1 archaeon SCGC-AAA382A13 TaxID=1698279 RepID=A0A133VGJ6_9EURY|nr:hypothetical protein AKJ50_00580 [candidate division MSBL1 archaeon SCGC-AAA382A13]